MPTQHTAPAPHRQAGDHSCGPARPATVSTQLAAICHAARAQEILLALLAAAGDATAGAVAGGGAGAELARAAGWTTGGSNPVLSPAGRGRLRRLTDDTGPHPAHAALALLTPQERRVAAQVCAGHTSRQSAHHLGCSSRTVDNHIANILTKLDLTNRHELTRLLAPALPPAQPPATPSAALPAAPSPAPAPAPLASPAPAEATFSGRHADPASRAAQDRGEGAQQRGNRGRPPVKPGQSRPRRRATRPRRRAGRDQTRSKQT